VWKSLVTLKLVSRIEVLGGRVEELGGGDSKSLHLLERYVQEAMFASVRCASD
jgi:hypothetical protein